MGKTNMQQGGISALGFIIILLMIAFFTMIALKLMPIYYENFKISSALRSLKKEPGINEKANVELRDIMRRRFRIDNIDDIEPSQIEFKHDRNKLLIVLDYEVRQEFFGNVDVVVSFDDRIEIENP